MSIPGSGCGGGTSDCWRGRECFQVIFMRLQPKNHGSRKQPCQKGKVPEGKATQKGGSERGREQAW